MNRSASLLLCLATTAALGSAVGPATAVALAGPASTTCDGLEATILVDPDDPTTLGTGGDDVIVGTDGADRIDGRGGDDVICGRGGDDVICGRGAADVLLGGAGDDRLYGERDSTDAGSSPPRVEGDTLDGGPDDDVLVTDPAGYDGAIDTLRFSGADGVEVDLVRGRATGLGEDVVVADGETAIVGTPGDDSLRGATAPTVMSGLGGDDDLVGGTASDTLAGGRGADVVAGGDGDDVLAGSTGDLLRGGSDDDVLNLGSAGLAVAQAGTGRDEITLRARTLGGLRARVGDDGRGDLLTLRLDGLRTSGSLSWNLATGRVGAPGAGSSVLPRVTRAEVLRLAAPTRVTGSNRPESVDVIYQERPVTFDGRGGADRFAGGEAVDAFLGGRGTDVYVADTSPRSGVNRCASVETDQRGACR